MSKENNGVSILNAISAAAVPTALALVTAGLGPGTVGLVAGAAVTGAVAAVADSARQAADQLARGRNEWALDWLIALEKSFETMNENADASARKTQEQLNEALKSREFWQLLGTYHIEAIRSVDRERMYMLAHAAACSMVCGFSVERLARVERALRVLYPSDVRHLRTLLQLEAALDLPHFEKAVRLRTALHEAPAGLYVEQSMCVRTFVGTTWQDNSREMAEITGLGRDVGLITEKEKLRGRTPEG
ncbi:MAG: hypothetical protein IPG17_21280 [Sandaracinaceae bacterium]|nr:hypothetical protein [Sandaracinaceae bacterium]